MTTKANDPVLDLAYPPIHNIVATAGQLDGMTIGFNVPGYGGFNNLIASSGALNGVNIGATNPSSGIFSTLGIANTASHGIVIGQGTSPVTSVAPSNVSGMPLLSNGPGTDPSFRLLDLSGPGVEGTVPNEVLPSNLVFSLTGNLTLYVATTGSDSNDGFTAATAFKTLQKAWSTLPNINLANYTVTINVANGTYTAGVAALGALQHGGTRLFPVSFVGNVANPQNCVISVTNGICFEAGFGASINISGFYMEATSSTPGQYGVAVAADFGSNININGPVIFGNCTNEHQTANTTGSILITSSYTIAGSSGVGHLLIADAGIVNYVNNVTITIESGVTWPTFVQCDALGLLYMTGNITFIQQQIPSGVPFICSSNAVIITLGQSFSTFPGATGVGPYYGGEISFGGQPIS